MPTFPQLTTIHLDHGRKHQSIPRSPTNKVIQERLITKVLTLTYSLPPIKEILTKLSNCHTKAKQFQAIA